MFVFLALAILYPNNDLRWPRSCYAVPEAINFDEKPICVKIDL